MTFWSNQTIVLSDHYRDFIMNPDIGVIFTNDFPNLHHTTERKSKTMIS